ncbi:DUF4340 domain-containing protein [Thermosulfurimonas marina]|uniref:DUF4340 domain-containing protein n=1 Tax=Thermosulfurimonas marina TaxID=2047767 RepID=A0A6H1WU35_9BACT|nr:DUF4340 domain-containing protein [Thermosulfurimonas marina]QJA06712.1 DUF4340 domain-containing protein [Thermosulfurimonas marina]
MSPRNLFFLSGLLLLLVLMYVIAQRAERPEALKGRVFVRVGQPDWSRADEVRVWFGKERRQGFRLIFGDGRWEVLPLEGKGFPRPAKEGLVRDLLKDLAELSGERRMEGRDYFARVALTPETALHLEGLREGRKLFSLLLGKRGPYWESTFFRLEGSEVIYLSPENLLARFEIWKEAPQPPKLDPWVDLTVLSPAPSGLESLVLYREGKEVFRLQREEEGFVWQRGKETRKLAAKEVEKRLREVFPLFAEEVVPPKKIPPRFRLVVKTSLREEELQVAPSGKVVFVRRGPYLFRVKAEDWKKIETLF